MHEARKFNHGDTEAQLKLEAVFKLCLRVSVSPWLILIPLKA
jgi:hypothetical protein